MIKDKIKLIDSDSFELGQVFHTFLFYIVLSLWILDDENYFLYFVNLIILSVYFYYIKSKYKNTQFRFKTLKDELK